MISLNPTCPSKLFVTVTKIPNTIWRKVIRVHDFRGLSPGSAGFIVQSLREGRTSWPDGCGGGNLLRSRGSGLGEDRTWGKMNPSRSCPQ